MIISSYSYQRLLFTLLQHAGEIEQSGVRRYCIRNPIVVHRSFNEIDILLRRLLTETNKILEAELNMRSFILSKGMSMVLVCCRTFTNRYLLLVLMPTSGVKDLSRAVSLPPNDFSIIDEKVCVNCRRLIKTCDYLMISSSMIRPSSMMT